FDTENIPNQIASQATIVPGGFQWLRITLRWDWIELVADACTQNNSSCHWEYTDQSIIDAASRGLGILAVITGVPGRAQGTALGASCAANDDGSYGPTSTTPMSHFARAAAMRYAGRVAAWEIGNEVNSCKWWKGTAPDFRNNYLAPAFDSIKGVDPAYLVGGP